MSFRDLHTVNTFLMSTQVRNKRVGQMHVCSRGNNVLGVTHPNALGPGGGCALSNASVLGVSARTNR